MQAPHLGATVNSVVYYLATLMLAGSYSASNVNSFFMVAPVSMIS